MTAINMGTLTRHANKTQSNTKRIRRQTRIKGWENKLMMITPTRKVECTVVYENTNIKIMNKVHQ